MNMKNVLLSASGILAIIPGIGQFTSVLPTPPGDKGFFVAVSGCFGVATILLLHVNRHRIERIKHNMVLKLSIALAVLFVMSFTVNVYLQYQTMFEEPDHSAAFIPVWVCPELEQLVENSGSRQEAFDEYGPDTFNKFASKNPWSLAVTKGLLLVVYQILFLIPVLLCGGLALRVDNKITDSP